MRGSFARRSPRRVGIIKVCAISFAAWYMHKHIARKVTLAQAMILLSYVDSRLSPTLGHIVDREKKHVCHAISALSTLAIAPAGLRVCVSSSFS